MANGDVWAVVDEIRKHSEEMAKTAVRIETTLQMHMSDPGVHQRPPCDQLKAITAKMWGGIAFIGTALIGLILDRVFGK